jgi:DivIVA domain-containing protein
MEITPQAINEVEFRQRVRGYDPDEVDEFLERMSTGVERLLDELRHANERALAAERRLATAGTAEPAGRPAPVDETEAISRTLILAQRTADAAVAEARDQAATTIAQANEQAARTVAEAREQSAAMVAEAETEARRQLDDTRQRVAAEVAELEATRDSLRDDVDLLERHVDEQRLRLRASIDELHRLLEDPGHLRLAPLPELSGAALPEFIRSPELEAEPEPTAAAEAEHESQLDDLDDLGEPETEPEAWSSPWSEREPFDQTPAEPLAPAPAPSDRDLVGTDAPLAAAAAVGRFDEAEEAAWARFAPDAVDLRNTDDDGPPTQAHRFDDDLAGDDAYLDELRRSMLDETGGTESSLFDREPDDAASRLRSRFGRKR